MILSAFLFLVAGINVHIIPSHVNGAQTVHQFVALSFLVVEASINHTKSQDTVPRMTLAVERRFVGSTVLQRFAFTCTTTKESLPKCCL